VRPVTIDPARGADQTIDSRVAPNGAIARVENLRVDKLGRLVLRNGYQSLGMTVQSTVSPPTLTPFDLHTVGDELVCLGNNGNGQTGIRAPYRYAPNARGVWRTETQQSISETDALFQSMCAADSVRVILTELSSVGADEVWCDCAVSSDGNYVALASNLEESLGPDRRARVTVIDATTGRTVLTESNVGGITTPMERNARLLAIGNVFYLFEQVTTDLTVRTWDSASSSQAFGTRTTIGAGMSAIPARYDVAPFIGTTDYLVAFPTATGYTWRRFNSANAQQTTTNVASLADAPVAICGATGESVSVVNIRAASGVELRTFNATTGVLTVGPTNMDPVGGLVFDWCNIQRLSSTQVIWTGHAVTGGQDFCYVRTATTAAHVLATMPQHDNTRFVSKTLIVDGVPMAWEVLGAAESRPFAMTSISTTTSSQNIWLNAIALDGKAPPQLASALVAPRFSAFVRGTGSRAYVALTTKDPRDKTFRTNLIECRIFSGERRQGVELGGVLYLAGGVTTQYDRRIATECGFDTIPLISTVTPNGSGGAMTLLGTYTFQIVYRFVSADDQTTQSAPSSPKSITLTGATNAVQLLTSCPFGIRLQRHVDGQGGQTYIDVYRTENAGSIPRLVKSQRVAAFTFGSFQTVNDGVSDAVQQTGALIYTQGGDGSVSGRLPLAIAAPCRNVIESDGKIILLGTERDTEGQLSLESRPGEAVGFSNDDRFFFSNPEPITGGVSSVDARRFVFGRRTIRELLGAGPNAAGVGELSEPVLLSKSVGAKDWRSVILTELGTFFQADDDKIYLLPLGGDQPVNAGEGIRNVLEQFPVIVSATRHEGDMLVTFVAQDTAGTDSRLLHLDLRTSGFGKSGWRGTWIVDRVADLEGESFPYIVEERIETFQLAPGATTVTITLPRGPRIGDRRVAVVFLDCANAEGALTAISSHSIRSSLTAGATQAWAFDGTISAASSLTVLTSDITFSGVLFPTAVIVKQYLLRGAHASAVTEVTQFQMVSGTSYPLPTLTPSWGLAKTLWLAAASHSSAFGDPGNPVIRTTPAGFAGVTRIESPTFTAPVTTRVALDSAFCMQQLRATAISGATFATPFSGNGCAFLIAMRPLAATGTPVRASIGYQGRLVVCSASDVRRNDAASFADGSAAIRGEWESADIYPMGTAGAGRHLMIQAIGEILGYCQVYAACSYDGGVSWTQLREYKLTQTFGFQLGKVVKLQWVPLRRKIDGVRVKIVQGDEGLLPSGPTAGFALNQVTLWFEDLAGPTRVQTSTTSLIGARR
jgi:hypothetical protein